MNIKLIKLLASVCVGLCLIVAGEWLYASYIRHSLLSSIITENPEDYKADELPKIELTKQPEAGYVDLVARPLFIKGRKAVAEQAPEASQVAAKAVVFDWQLSGIYSTSKTVSALLTRDKLKVAKDNYRKISVGTDLDGWTLSEIRKDSVLFKQGGIEKELLVRKPKPKTSAPKGDRAAPNSSAPPPPAAIPEPAADTTEETFESEQQ